MDANEMVNNKSKYVKLGQLFIYYLFSQLV